jgi:hypothetical protein
MGEKPPMPLPPAAPREGEDEVELELDEAVVLDRPAARRRSAAPASRAPAAVPPDLGMLNLDADAVRSMLADKPDLLESGLAAYADENGEPVGAGFPSPVGRIDLLARDKGGAFVVVMVPEGDPARIVPDVVQRIGWVRKHVAGSKAVRGVVVLQELPEEVAYAAAGVAGTVSFKAFRVALSFQELEV